MYFYEVKKGAVPINYTELNKGCRIKEKMPIFLIETRNRK